MITFRIVDHNEVGLAYLWHKEFANADDAIFPRSEEEFNTLALERCLWGAFDESGKVAGLSYIKVENNKKSIELGGLMVSADFRGKGLGEALLRLPLAHLLINEQPLQWTPQPIILTHALQDNSNPQTIIKKCGFELAKPVKLPSEQLPGLRSSDDGFIYGNEFHLKIPHALSSLSSWLRDWDGTLRGGISAIVDLRDGESLPMWADLVMSMAETVEEKKSQMAHY